MIITLLPYSGPLPPCGRGIPDGSIVAMPHLVGGTIFAKPLLFGPVGCHYYSDLPPGYTRYTRREWVPPGGMGEELRALIAGEGERTRVPLILEPPFIKDLLPRILGVIENTPADRAGLKRGDIITAVNGKRPFSRVDAFRQVQEAEKVVIDFCRDGATFQVCLEGGGCLPGFVMASDLDRFSANLLIGCGGWCKDGPLWPHQSWRHPSWYPPWKG